MKYFKKVFLFLILPLASGCTTTKWQWFPQDSLANKVDRHSLQSKWAKEEKEAGVFYVDVVKVSF